MGVYSHNGLLYTDNCIDFVDNTPYSKGLGVDLGLKDFAIYSNGLIKKI